MAAGTARSRRGQTRVLDDSIHAVGIAVLVDVVEAVARLVETGDVAGDARDKGACLLQTFFHQLGAQPENSVGKKPLGPRQVLGRSSQGLARELEQDLGSIL